MKIESRKSLLELNMIAKTQTNAKTDLAKTNLAQLLETQLDSDKIDLVALQTLAKRLIPTRRQRNISLRTMSKTEKAEFLQRNSNFRNNTGISVWTSLYKSCSPRYKAMAHYTLNEFDPLPGDYSEENEEEAKLEALKAEMIAKLGVRNV